MEILSHKTKLRVRYPETDAMGYVHHSVYPQYYEYARIEMLREKGILYTEMEKNGIMLPVRELHITYLQPARFDDELTIKTILREKPHITLNFDFEIYNQNNLLINKASIVLVFANTSNGKPNRTGHLYLEPLFK